MVTNLQIMSESPEYKGGSELEEELTVEEKKAIAQTLKKIRKKKLEQRTEDEEDAASDVEEIVSPALLWERLKEFTETQGGRRSTSSSSSSGSTVVASLERKFEVLKCSKEKGNPLSADQVHTFADILSSNSSKRGSANPYTKADLLSFVEQKAQALITSRHQARCLEEEEAVTNIFELPVPEFAARLKLFHLPIISYG